MEVSSRTCSYVVCLNISNSWTTIWPAHLTYIEIVHNSKWFEWESYRFVGSCPFRLWPVILSTSTQLLATRSKKEKQILTMVANLYNIGFKKNGMHGDTKPDCKRICLHVFPRYRSVGCEFFGATGSRCADTENRPIPSYRSWNGGIHKGGEHRYLRPAMETK